jgi:succinyl-diaminopimelate desuccinylase
VAEGLIMTYGTGVRVAFATTVGGGLMGVPADDLRRLLDEDGVVALTRALVRVRSVNDPAAGCSEAAAAEVVLRQMRSWGWTPRVEEVAPGRPNVVAVVEGVGPGPTLMFEGHTDVVTEGDRRSWTVDPYGAELRAGRIWGRGSADMKSGLAAMLHAVRALQLAGFPGRVVVAALVDEEGLMLGAKHFARTWREQIGGRIDGVIVCEPEDGEVCAVAKGAVRLRIGLTGAMAHGAMPQHARNPIPVAAQVVPALAAIERRLLAEHGAHEHLGPAYLTPTVLLAGDTDQMNVIPARAVLCVDVRTVPGVDHAALIADVTAAAREAAAPAGVTVDVEVVDDRPPVDTPRTAPVVVALAAAHESVTGQPARYGGVPGATDGTILSRDAGLDTVVYGPGGKWIAHQADEYVEVADVLRAAQVYAEAARVFLAGDLR